MIYYIIPHVYPLYIILLSNYYYLHNLASLTIINYCLSIQGFFYYSFLFVSVSEVQPTCRTMPHIRSSELPQRAASPRRAATASVAATGITQADTIAAGRTRATSGANSFVGAAPVANGAS
jgi:hypothetical protein